MGKCAITSEYRWVDMPTNQQISSPSRCQHCPCCPRCKPVILPNNLDRAILVQLDSDHPRCLPHPPGLMTITTATTITMTMTTTSVNDDINDYHDRHDDNHPHNDNHNPSYSRLNRKQKRMLGNKPCYSLQFDSIVVVQHVGI